MTITISGKQIEVSGKARNVTMDRNRLGYTENFVSIDFNGKELSYSVENKCKNGRVDIIKHEFDNVESVKEYDNAIYIYAKGAYDGEKHQIVFYKK